MRIGRVTSIYIEVSEEKLWEVAFDMNFEDLVNMQSYEMRKCSKKEIYIHTVSIRLLLNKLLNEKFLIIGYFGDEHWFKIILNFINILE